MNKEKQSSPILRYGRNALIGAVLIIVYAYSFNVTEIDLPN